MAAEEKSRWDKAAIVLQPVGGLLTALSVALVGIFGSQYLDRQQARDVATRDRQQARDANIRLYADLMSKREEADSILRKDMFDSILRAFLKPGSTAPEQKVLHLELLAYNFHESFDLSPLFKQVYKQIDPRTKAGQEYLKRLKKVASEVASKQIAALEESGENAKLDGTIVFDEIDKNLQTGTPVMEGTLTMHPNESRDLDPALRKRYFRVDALYVDRDRQELRVKLKVKTPSANDEMPPGEVDDVDTTFWIGFFDFPLIDNTRLAHGQRCAITVKDFNPSRAHITLIYFPGSRASLKEKPYYEEVINSLARENARPSIRMDK